MVGEPVSFRLAEIAGTESAEIIWTITGPVSQTFSGKGFEFSFPQEGKYELVVEVVAPTGESAKAAKDVYVKGPSTVGPVAEAEASQELSLVLAKAELLENHGLGSDWEFSYSLGEETAAFGLGDLPLTLYQGAPKALVLRFRVVERDEAKDDVAEADLTLAEGWGPGERVLEVTVYEDGIAGSASYARWKLVIQLVSGSAPSPGSTQGTQTSPRGTGPSSSGSAVSEEGLWDLFASFQLPPLGFSLVAAGDLDGDGLADLAAGQVRSTSVHLFQGLGTGQFQEMATFSLGIIPDRIILADFNGDARGDLITVNWTDRQARLLLGQGNFRLSAPIPVGMPAGAWNVLVTQLNANLGAELVWITQSGPVVWSFTRQGGVIQWKTAPHMLSFVMLPPAPYVWGDLNRDGALEIAYYSANPGEVFILAQTGQRLGFTETPRHVPLVQLEVGDVDGDGLPDLLGLDQLGNVHIWRAHRR